MTSLRWSYREFVVFVYRVRQKNRRELDETTTVKDRRLRSTFGHQEKMRRTGS